MEDMERRIQRGDVKQEKLDAIQVGLFSLILGVWLIISVAGNVRHSFRSSEEIDLKELDVTSPRSLW